MREKIRKIVTWQVPISQVRLNRHESHVLWMPETLETQEEGSGKPLLPRRTNQKKKKKAKKMLVDSVTKLEKLIHAKGKSSILEARYFG
ncbi:hypothetical protein P7H20_25510 [Paenibacillus larvae]|nr:hypothetical protein [Paenibacillus larvae]MDT2277526.1 hypothetical protein [Paenibacillus larvae]